MLVLLAILCTSCYHSHLYKPGDTVKMTDIQDTVLLSRLSIDNRTSLTSYFEALGDDHDFSFADFAFLTSIGIPDSIIGSIPDYYLAYYGHAKEYLVVASRHHHIPSTRHSVSRTEMTLKLIDAKTFDSLSSTFIVRDISVCWQICLAIFMIVLGIVLIRALHARYYISGILLFLLMLCGYFLIWSMFSYLFALFLSIWLLFIAKQTLLHYLDLYKKQ